MYVNNRTNLIGGGNLESKSIELLRFPMAVLILLLHSSFTHEVNGGISIFEEWNAPIYNTLDKIFVGNITNIAVPLFFLISGYLFFLRNQEFTFVDYREKLEKRTKSLLVPYLLWNALIFIVYLLVQSFVPSMTSGRTKLIADYSFTDYIMCLWSMKYVNEGGVSGPIDSPLWFVRDLIIMSLLSPLIWWAIRRLKSVVPLILIALFVSGEIQGIPGLSISAVTFFSLGAYLGIYKIRFAEISLRLLPYTLTCYLLLLVLLLTLNLPVYLHYSEIVIGVIMSCGFAAWACTKGGKINAFLTGSTFFVFASHCEFLKVFIRISSRMGIQNDLFYCVMYFVCPLLTLIILLFMYKLLRKYLPQVATLLSGGR